MKIVKTDGVSRIFSDDLIVTNEIPLGTYKVCFSSMTGFYLEDADDFKITEQPYGKHPLKIPKVLQLFKTLDRSAGIILSGKKGMGKSMFARLLSVAFAEEMEMPTIIIADAFPGIVNFLDSIKQEVMLLFDEYEKVFDSGEGHRTDNNNRVPQESQEQMLSLFDGLSQIKRMYVITVNEIRKVNQYMLNRPGRFHYHFQFNYPSVEEVEMYLNDKLLPERYDQIPLVKRFSNRFELNYDSLRAIAFELNSGYNFLETMEDLNISSTENEPVIYNVVVHHSNGLMVKTDININLMSAMISMRYDTDTYDSVYLTFSPLEIEIHSKESFTATSEQVDFKVTYDDENQVLTNDSGITIDKIVFTKREFGRPQYGKELENLLV
jgi:hypothetical protein